MHPNSVLHGPHLSVDILLGTAFIDQAIRGSFQAERNFAARHSEPVAVGASKSQNTKVKVVGSSITEIKKN